MSGVEWDIMIELILRNKGKIVTHSNINILGDMSIREFADRKRHYSKADYNAQMNNIFMDF
mgnify:CR=1 FL=1